MAALTATWAAEDIWTIKKKYNLLHFYFYFASHGEDVIFGVVGGRLNAWASVGANWKILIRLDFVPTVRILFVACRIPEHEQPDLGVVHGGRPVRGMRERGLARLRVEAGGGGGGGEGQEHDALPRALLLQGRVGGGAVAERREHLRSHIPDAVGRRAAAPRGHRLAAVNGVVARPGPVPQRPELQLAAAAPEEELLGAGAVELGRGRAERRRRRVALALGDRRLCFGAGGHFHVVGIRRRVVGSLEGQGIGRRRRANERVGACGGDSWAERRNKSIPEFWAACPHQININSFWI